MEKCGRLVQMGNDRNKMLQYVKTQFYSIIFVKYWNEAVNHLSQETIKALCGDVQ